MAPATFGFQTALYSSEAKNRIDASEMKIAGDVRKLTAPLRASTIAAAF